MTRPEDVKTAIAAGATHIGFILVPYTKRHISMDQLEELSALADGSSVRKVGIYRNATREFILNHQKAGALDIIQLHGTEPPEFAQQFEGTELWKAFHLQTKEDIEAAAQYPADYILADGERAGSGELCNWDRVAELATRRPVILAGGITPDNAVEALRKTGACGLDLSTGVEESPGIKSKEKLKQLFQQLKTL